MVYAIKLLRKPHEIKNSAYNYAEGRILNLEELVNNSSFTDPYQVFTHARRKLKLANADSRHNQRLKLAMIAFNIFIMLFVAQTGMNWAQVISLAWSECYDTEVPQQNIRVIKWRAGNKVCHFELPTSFMPVFRKFLNLRKYLLADRPCDWLFFRFIHSIKTGIPLPLKNGLNSIYITLRRIDPELPKITPRQWRAAKSDWLIRNTDISTTAL